MLVLHPVLGAILIIHLLIDIIIINVLIFDKRPGIGKLVCVIGWGLALELVLFDEFLHPEHVLAEIHAEFRVVYALFIVTSDTFHNIVF